MYLDYWIICIFAVLFGICAWWNRREGFLYGIESTLILLRDKKIIDIEDDQIVAYKNPEGKSLK